MGIESSIRYAESMARLYSQRGDHFLNHLAKARNTDPSTVAAAHKLKAMFTEKADHYAQIASRLRAYASPDNLDSAS